MHLSLILELLPRALLGMHRAPLMISTSLDQILIEKNRPINRDKNMSAPSKAKAIKLDNPAQAKSNQQPETELHMLGGNE